MLWNCASMPQENNILVKSYFECFIFDLACESTVVVLYDPGITDIKVMAPSFRQDLQRTIQIWSSVRDLRPEGLILAMLTLADKLIWKLPI